MNRWKMLLVLVLAAVTLTGCTERERQELREKVMRYLKMIYPVQAEKKVD